MPYIKAATRASLDRGSIPREPGDLNYVITKHMIDALDRSDLNFLHNAILSEVNFYINGKAPSYRLYNEVMGVLDCAEREFRRRMGDQEQFFLISDAIQDVATEFYAAAVAPYEDKKIQENGDIYS